MLTLGALAGVAVVLAVGALGLRAAQGDTVLAGVSVDAEPVAGLTRAELEEAVQQQADDRTDAEVTVLADQERARGTRGDAGEVVLVEQAVEQAWTIGRRGPLQGTLDHLRARTGTEVDVQLDSEVDDATLAAWASDVADSLSEEPTAGGLTLIAAEATVEVTDPEPGLRVEPEDVTAAFRPELGHTEGAVEVRVEKTTVEPDITQADLDAVLPAAEASLAAAVTLANPVDAEDLVLEPDDLAEVLEIRTAADAAQGERLRLTTDAERLADHLGADGVAALETAPSDASWSVDGLELEVVEGRPGFAVDLEAAADRALELAGTPPDDGDRGDQLPGDTTDPEVTTEDLDVREEVGAFSTPLNPGEPRNHNILLAAELLAGAVIEPGETFSLDDHLGPRSSERGFQDNGFIDADGELISVVGGGVSQLGTTFMNAAWFAGVRLLEFQPHSLYFERYPMGREATLAYGTIDVVVENDSPSTIVVGAGGTEEEVTVRFFSTPWAEVDTWTGTPYAEVEGEVRDGFTIDFGRTITTPDGERSEDYTHTYRPEDEPEDEPDADDDG